MSDDATHQMVMIPPVQTPNPMTFGVWDDSLTTMRRFVLDMLVHTDRFIEVAGTDGEVETRAPVILNLVPRPDNPHTREAISIARPPGDGGSVLDRHMGYLANVMLKVWGESLHRLAANAAPVPIGCHGWVSLRKIDKLDVLSGSSVLPVAQRRRGDRLWGWNSWDFEWAVDRDAPFSRAELFKIGYRIDHVFLDMPLPGHLEKMIDVYLASRKK